MSNPLTAPGSLSEEHATALMELATQLRTLGPGGKSDQLEQALKTIGCSTEHEALLYLINLALQLRNERPNSTGTP